MPGRTGASATGSRCSLFSVVLGTPTARLMEPSQYPDHNTTFRTLVSVFRRATDCERPRGLQMTSRHPGAHPGFVVDSIFYPDGRIETDATHFSAAGGSQASRARDRSARRHSSHSIRRGIRAHERILLVYGRCDSCRRSSPVNLLLCATPAPRMQDLRARARARSLTARRSAGFPLGFGNRGRAHACTTLRRQRLPGSDHVHIPHSTDRGAVTVNEWARVLRQWDDVHRNISRSASESTFAALV
ncbi:hypothetical protein C8Q79DRAFT_250414 [Trametes meyenii]|nr:hypothetical protein C8Q79DRAFT_250414 [Trametes meyenii]